MTISDPPPSERRTSAQTGPGKGRTTNEVIMVECGGADTDETDELLPSGKPETPACISTPPPICML